MKHRIKIPFFFLIILSVIIASCQCDCDEPIIINPDPNPNPDSEVLLDCECNDIIGKKWFWNFTDREDLIFDKCSWYEDFIFNENGTITFYRYHGSVENVELIEAANWEVSDSPDGCEFKISNLDPIKYQLAVLDSIRSEGCWLFNTGSPMDYHEINDQDFFTHAYTINHEKDVNGRLLNDTVTCSYIHITARFTSFIDREP